MANDKNVKEQYKTPDIPDYYFLDKEFTEDFKKLVVEMGIVGKPVEKEKDDEEDK